MISFLDYIKYFATLAPESGAIFSGNNITTFFNSFPKVNNKSYYFASKDVEDMSQFRFIGFWQFTGEEETVIVNNYAAYKCNIVNPETDEIVGYYYKVFPSSTSGADMIEINGTLYVGDSKVNNVNFKIGNTVYYLGLRKNRYGTGAIINPLIGLEMKENYLLIISDGGWSANTSYNYNTIRGVVDLENQKVCWDINNNGIHTWENFKYWPGSNNKIISKDDYPGSTYNIKVNIDIEDEEFSHFQYNGTANGLEYMVVADYTMISNLYSIEPAELVVFDVPQKLLEKYGNNYTVKVLVDGTGSQDYTTNKLRDAVFFQFICQDKKVKRYVQVVYHPSTHNWCEIYNTTDINENQFLNYPVLVGLQGDYLNVELNFIDQSSIDLDIYKKMGEIGNGLMLFDDETEDLKYLYDTKNKELYNEYCDLIGTNAITFKK